MSLSHDTPQRYAGAAVFLHWTMALAFTLMLLSGLAMTTFGLERKLLFQMYQWHKALGVLLLLAFFARAGVRLLARPPAMPVFMARWEMTAAKLGHAALYACMILMPLSGWLLVSSSKYGAPTLVFGWFSWPHVPGIGGNTFINDIASQAHWLLAIGFAVAIAAHLAGTFKHAVLDRHSIVPRMWFGSKKAAASALGLAAALLFAGFMWPVQPSTQTAAAPQAAAAAAQPKASGYLIDYGRSAVSFSGVHAGDAFTGQFARWSGDVVFDVADLHGSSADIRFELASASTGSSFYDGSLPAADWFDVANHPQGIFTSDAMTANKDGSFKMEGLLALRGIEKPVAFDFTVTPDGSGVHVTGQAVVQRLDYRIGEDSDPDAEWVDNDITISLDLYAAP